MSESTYFVPRETPSKLLDRIAVAAKHWPASQQMFLHVYTQVPQVTEDVQVSLDNPEASLQRVRELFDKHPSLRVTQFYLDRENPHRNATRIRYKECSGEVSASLQIINHEQDDENLSALAVIDKAFAFVDRVSEAMKALPPIVSQNLQAHRDSVSALEQQVAKIGEFATEQIKRNAEHIREVTDRVNATYEEKEAELRQGIEQQRGELGAREKEITKRESDLNIRESRKVRRDLLDKLTEVLDAQKKAQLSEDTKQRADTVSRQSWTVVWGAGLLALASIGGIAFMTTKAGVESGVAWWVLIPLMTASSIVTVTTVIYRLKFSADAYKLHADTEMSVLKFKQDILRASWVAELMFEAATADTDKGREAVAIDNELLMQLAHGLFEYEASHKPSAHPLDDLSKYAKQFKKLSVGPVQVESQG